MSLSARVGAVAWRLYIGLGVAVTVVLCLVLPPDSGLLDPIYLTAIGSAPVVVGFAIVVARDSSRDARVAWGLLATGLSGYFAGDALWVHYARAGQDPYPSLADALFLGGTIVMIGGAFVLARARRGPLDRWTQIDVAIVVLATSSVVWTLNVRPYVLDGELSFLERVVSGAYPFLDILLVAAIGRLLMGGRRPPTGLVLLLASIGLLTVTDVVYFQQELAGTYVEWGWIDAGWVLSTIGIGAAALHPSAFRIEQQETAPLLGVRRLLLLVGATTTPLVLMGLGGLGLLDVHFGALALLAATATALLVARTWVLIEVTREIAVLRGEQRFASMVRNANDAIIVVDVAGTVTFASPSLRTRWGIEPDDLVGASIASLVAPPDAGEVFRWLDGMLTLGRSDSSLDVDWVDGYGKRRTVHLTATDLRDDPDVAGLLLTARDISDRVALEEELRLRAEHDPLTRIANRATFRAELLAAATDARTASTVLFIDVDDFKRINDGLGHAVGDKLLVELARRLVELLRPEDVVARLGGDEFAVLLAGVEDAGAAEAIASRIASSLGAPTVLGGESIAVTVSIGLAALAPDDVPGDVLRRADLAMYSAKHAGKSRCAWFTDDLAERAARELRLRTRIATAIAREEMRLVYQPIVAVPEGRLAAIEALLRWDLDGEPVGPDEFIPIAEATGDIVPIGAWVLTRACRDVVEHFGAGDDGPVLSVNVSAVQLDRGLSSAVATALEETLLPPHRLQLELTESLMAEELPATAFLALREHGVQLAIDDFGTGWCSLSYLQRFPVDVIKIDRSFLVDVVARPQLVAGIAQLIEATGAAAVAEGVETIEQLDVLGDMSIAQVQGWLFSRGVPIDEAARYTPDVPRSASHEAGSGGR